MTEVAPGTQIGPYKIGEKLGKGAFAMVYKAFDTETGDFVAVTEERENFFCELELGS